MNAGRQSLRHLVRLTVATILVVIVMPNGVYAEDLSTDELALVKAAEKARVDTIDSVYGSVVAIYGNDRKGGGSGVVFDPAGYALTNHHVVAGAGANGWAGLADRKLYRWRLIGTDPGGDIAIIQLLGKDKFEFAPLGISDSVRVGDMAMAMGNPFVLAEDQRPTVTLGIVSGVGRYQYGAGKNTLVYGNCIQVDSSINPGNSGGPLFDMTGHVIGINGRGSFKERGRVNVGLGYAVSMKQVRYFIPELLATKVAQHATLDAQFSDRLAGVVCHAINLDSPAAKAGLQLGDVLVAFDGEPIKSANQYTNLISTLPEGWPATVTHRRGDEVHNFTVRLTALPYGKQRPEAAKPPGKPAPKKKEGDEKGKPKPLPIHLQKKKLTLGKPGEIGNLERNREAAATVLSRLRKGSSPGVTSGGFYCEEELFRDGNLVGKQQVTLAADGRFRINYVLDDSVEQWQFDGKQFSRGADTESQDASLDAALADPFASSAFYLSNLLTNKPLTLVGQPQLDGADKASKQRAYRIQFPGDVSPRLLMWVSMFDTQGRPQLRLLKSGLDADGAGSIPSVTYANWQKVGGALLPSERTFVKGIDETTSLKIVAREWTVLDQLPENFPGEASDANKKP